MHEEGGSKATSASETTFEDSKDPEKETSKQPAHDLKIKDPDIKDTEAVTELEKDVKPKKDEEDDIEYPHGPKLWIILSALCLAVFLVALDQTIISTAIPKITDHFKSIQDIGWYGSSYLLTTTALQPTFGRVYTIFSIKTTFIIAIALFELGSLVCATAPTSKALIVGRAIAGLGSGGIFSGAIVILAYCLPLRKRPAAFGLIGGMWGIASVAGPLLGGVFTLPIGAIAIVVILLVLHIDRENNPDKLSTIQRILQLDLIGAALIIPTVVMLLLALQWGGSTYAWSNSRIIGLFCGFGGLLIIFLYSQWRLGDKATLPFRLFRDRNVLLALLFALFFGSAFFALIFYLAIYFQSIKGSSATEAGIQLLPLLIATVLSSIATGGLISVIGSYVPVMLISMILFSIGAGLITTFNLTTTLPHWFGYQVLTGLGIGVGFQGGILVVQTVLPLSSIPVATACIAFFQSLGGALFISVAQTLFQNGLLTGLKENTPDLDPKLFLNIGATQIRSTLETLGKEEELEGVLKAYVLGLRHTFWITAACAIAAFFCACGLQWKSVKKGHGQEGGVAVAV